MKSFAMSLIKTTYAVLFIAGLVLLATGCPRRIIIP